MILIPAIDLKGGKVVRLFQGDFSKEKVYGDAPFTYAKHFEKVGAKRLHIVDLDGAKDGRPVHKELILSLVKEICIPVQVGGGIRTEEDVSSYLERGVSQVILGTKAVEDLSFLERLCDRFPQRVIVSVDVKGEFVAISGWLEVSSVRYLDFIRRLNDLPLFAIILTLIERDGTQAGIDFERLTKALEVSRHPLILAGGLATIEDLKLLKPLSQKGLFGAISGRAIYEGTLDLEAALRYLETPS
ncbi:MAG: 1-(5-phosphoribosyl)-5-[(5-phosphoribosylamino)methylideneamino]imidazole-4-carboxamide isomerase [Thermodesulfobacterium sp.]|nr:1-(5-phosphoribosyl)-5-[(5-phosphoribosylamino)methylideneamino]imidazole-4-carboxamide isomerase [Thermodesulfobacterium sp.]